MEGCLYEILNKDYLFDFLKSVAKFNLTTSDLFARPQRCRLMALALTSPVSPVHASFASGNIGFWPNICCTI